MSLRAFLPPVCSAVLAVLVALPSCVRPLAAGEGPRRGEARAVMVEKGPVIDGTLKDPAWEMAAVLPMGEATGTGPGTYATSARLLFDSQFLYLAFLCDEPDTAGIRSKVKDLDGEVWADDCVEVMPTSAFHQHNACGKLEGVEVTAKVLEEIQGLKRDAWAPGE